MSRAVLGKTVISPLRAGTVVSYELQGTQITARFLGLVRIHSFELAEVSEFRLAASDEPPGLMLAVNRLLFYCWSSGCLPIYLLRVGKRRCFIKLSRRSREQLLSALRRVRGSAAPLRKAA